MSSHESTNAATPRQIGRRAAMKAGVGVGVGAVVWAEPTIKGLVRRPAYASGGSNATENITISGSINGSVVSALSFNPTSINGVAIMLSPATWTNPNNGNVLPRIQVDSPTITFTTVTNNGGVLVNPPQTPINNNGSRLRLRRNLNQTFSIQVDMTCA